MVALRELVQLGGVLLLEGGALAVEGLDVVEPGDAAGNLSGVRCLAGVGGVGGWGGGGTGGRTQALTGLKASWDGS